MLVDLLKHNAAVYQVQLERLQRTCTELLLMVQQQSKIAPNKCQNATLITRQRQRQRSNYLGLMPHTTVPQMVYAVYQGSTARARMRTVSLLLSH